MKKYVKKLVGVVLALTLCFCMFQVNGTDVYADNTITGNNTRATAYNYGKWSTINSNYSVVVLEDEQEESWLKFTLSPGERIYLKATYDEDYEGEWFEIQDGVGNEMGKPQYTPGAVYNIDSITPCVYLDCDNDSTSTKTYYLVLHRGSVDKDKNIYFCLSAYNRIKTASTTVAISGTATNAGNKSLSTSGINSSIITVDLTNNTTLPDEAIVTSISTSGTQSPGQGNVHHMIMPANNGIWYTSTITSATSGSYDIDVNDNIPLKQLWSFRYNAKATAKSTMKNVKLKIKFQYDLHDNGYETYIN